VICSFARFLLRNASFWRRRRVIVFRGWTEPWTFLIGGPWVGPSSLRATAVGPGPAARSWPIRGPFSPVFGSFSHVFSVPLT
jgi:hypothetical protein